MSHERIGGSPSKGTVYQFGIAATTMAEFNRAMLRLGQALRATAGDFARLVFTATRTWPEAAAFARSRWAWPTWRVCRRPFDWAIDDVPTKRGLGEVRWYH